jgi:hypothetical protein
MSIKYDLIHIQIESMDIAIQEAQTKHPEHQFHADHLKGVKQLLETIRDEECSTNLNPWETDADYADNEYDSSVDKG